MAETSNIQWCDGTFNPWIGCTKVSPGCKNCYADAQDKFRKWTPEGWGKGKPRRRTSEDNWRNPVKWNRDAAAGKFLECECGWRGWEKELDVQVGGIFQGIAACPECDAMEGMLNPVRPRVFCASLADWLDDEVPIEWLADLLDLIRLTQNLDWLLLTKRPENFRRRLLRVVDEITGNLDLVTWVYNWLGQKEDRVFRYVASEPPANVWIGTTVENQEVAEKRISELLQLPAIVHFLSCEPLLSPLTLWPPCFRLRPDKQMWVIAGGESGPECRPAELSSFRSLRDQCASAGVPFFMKQLGGVRNHRGNLDDFPEDLQVRQFPVGKAVA